MTPQRKALTVGPAPLAADGPIARHALAIAGLAHKALKEDLLKEESRTAASRPELAGQRKEWAELRRLDRLATEAAEEDQRPHDFTLPVPIRRTKEMADLTHLARFPLTAWCHWLKNGGKIDGKSQEIHVCQVRSERAS